MFLALHELGMGRSVSGGMGRSVSGKKRKCDFHTR